MTARIDHLVVIASSLDQGVAWCEATLGVTPGPGGEHPLMGTHNRLLRIATVDFPRAYLEIIAINPGAPSARPVRAARWFDMDDEALRSRVAASGPQLAHFVACVPDVRTATAALAAQGIDRGKVVPASRETPRGLLQWRITVRDDGQRLFYGALPTLIEWGETHPAGGMGESGVTLHSLAATHPRAQDLRQAYEAIGLQGVALKDGPPNLCATLLTPRGRVQLESKGI
jgi:hypothetical protein